jgi:hypothetical protein
LLVVLFATSGLVGALAGGQVPEATAASSWGVSVAAGSSGLGRAGALTAPTGVVATCAGGRTVTVTWDAVPEAASFTIERSITSATSGFTDTATGQTGTSWTSGSLANGSTYWFRVRAVRGLWTATSASSQGRTITGGACS